LCAITKHSYESAVKHENSISYSMLSRDDKCLPCDMYVDQFEGKKSKKDNVNLLTARQSPVSEVSIFHGAEQQL
jgi:predicted dithiol-disulfide oxidoreductase (DUF899 family)